MKVPFRKPKSTFAVQAAEENEVGFAAQGQETYDALRKRGRTIILRGFLSAVAVFVGDLLLRFVGSNNTLIGTIFALVLLGFFVCFVGSIWAWFGFVHMRRILQYNPWVEWYVKSKAIRVSGLTLVHVMVLVHPDWPDEVVRTLHPARTSQVMLGSSVTSVWAAGNPDYTMAVSPAGGALPVHGLRPPFEKLRVRLIAFAQSEQA